MLSENTKRIIGKTREYFKESNAKGLVFGLSGGLDSATAAYLLKEAVGKENITALLMPDTKITSKESLDDSIQVAEALGINYYIVTLDKSIDSFKELPWKQNAVAEANLKARLRMLLLYNYANSNNCFVAGTSNRTECLLGYFTKYGDGAADFLLLAGVLKTELKQVAEELGVPKHIISKKPSAELWQGQTDEEELGIDYETADLIIKEHIDKEITKEELIEKGISEKNIELVVNRIENNKHKNNMPEVF